MRVTELSVHRQQAVAVAAIDELSGATYEFRASTVVNCAGPWSRKIAARFHRDLPQLFPVSIAFNLLLARDFPCQRALAVRPKLSGAQTYFLYGWKGMTLAGTRHLPYDGTGQDCRIPGQAVDEFLRHLNIAIPGFDLQRSDVLRIHSGLLPAQRHGSNKVATRPIILDHSEHGGPAGLYSVSGVKHTTARLVAERTLDRICARQRRASQPLSGPPRPPPGNFMPVDDFCAVLREHRGAAANIVRRICEREAVFHLDDLLLRRTDWGMDPRVGKSLAIEVASLLNWDEERTTAELNRLNDQDQLSIS